MGPTSQGIRWLDQEGEVIENFGRHHSHELRDEGSHENSFPLLGGGLVLRLALPFPALDDTPLIVVEMLSLSIYFISKCIALTYPSHISLIISSFSSDLISPDLSDVLYLALLCPPGTRLHCCSLVSPI